MTEEEFDRVTKLAQTTVLSREEFIRQVLRGTTIRERPPAEYEENSSYSTIDFVKRAIIFFGYAPKTIQTDNGAEFTHFTKTKRTHP
ncbi:MAG: hypothetical protein IJW55_09770, partial [Clostridia bacterium]|nr:hypothetical protein [Clostridia bacterium]